MRLSSILLAWWLPVSFICGGLVLLVSCYDSSLCANISYCMMLVGVIWLLFWASSNERITKGESLVTNERPSTPPTPAVHDFRPELEARIREAAEFRAELAAKQDEIATLKAGLNRTDTSELNEAIADFFVAFEFERSRAEGSTSEALQSLQQPFEHLFSAASLIKGYPNPGERFVDQPAGSCKVFKTEPATSPDQKGTIKVVRSPWVGFMVNEKLKVVVASNISVYA